jgi:hypothetical protein
MNDTATRGHSITCLPLSQDNAEIQPLRGKNVVPEADQRTAAEVQSTNVRPPI